MNMTKFLAPALAGALLIGAAHAEPVGKVSNVEGDILALRGGETVALVSGDAVLANDRIIARDAASASVEAFGCVSAVETGAMVTVNDAMCDAAPVSFGSAQVGAIAASNLFVTAALIATPAIIGVAISESDDEERNVEPVSP